MSHTLARRTDPATSHEAAAKVIACGLNESHGQVILKALSSIGPACIDRIAEHTGIAAQKLNKRVIDLERKGKVKRPGDTQINRSGNAEQVIHLAQEQ